MRVGGEACAEGQVNLPIVSHVISAGVSLLFKCPVSTKSVSTNRAFFMYQGPLPVTVSLAVCGLAKSSHSLEFP